VIKLVNICVICGRIKDIKMREYEIIYQIRGAIYDTYNTLGPGLLEAVYEEALVYFLVKRGLHVDRQVEVPIEIEGHRLKNQMRLDILVEYRVIIEIKSVIDMREVFHLQLLTYLKLTKLHRGVLVNFNTDSINDSIWLKVNGFDSDVMLSNDKQEKIESDL
jgi:GxxExxY protein